MGQSLVEMLITVVTGVLVFIGGQIFMEYSLKPIQDYKRLKSKVAKALVYYANCYSNPVLPTDTYNTEPWSKGEEAIRELAAEVKAFTEIMPWRPFVLWLIPCPKRLLDASACLVGLSNSFFADPLTIEFHNEQVKDNIDIIHKNMGIL